jgi:hypothetical protein
MAAAAITSPTIAPPHPKPLRRAAVLGAFAPAATTAGPLGSAVIAAAPGVGAAGPAPTVAARRLLAGGRPTPLGI